MEKNVAKIKISWDTIQMIKNAAKEFNLEEHEIIHDAVCLYFIEIDKDQKNENNYLEIH